MQIYGSPRGTTINQRREKLSRYESVEISKIMGHEFDKIMNLDKNYGVFRNESR